MYLQRDQANALLQTSLTTIKERLHAHLDFVTELREGDDWSFVIKAQALLEACITEAILVRLGDDRIKKIVETMPLVGNNASKLQFAKDLGLMNASQRRFVKKLATLRNHLAHRVEYVNFKYSRIHCFTGQKRAEGLARIYCLVRTDAISPRTVARNRTQTAEISGFNGCISSRSFACCRRQSSKTHACH